MGKMTSSPLNRLVAKLESAETLDGLGRTAGRTVRQLVPDGAVKETLGGAWLGHPLHPILTDIPIGVWTSSVLLDWTGGKDSQSASDRLILIGLLAAGATAASGWSDWADSEQEHADVRRSGLVHAAANATAVALMLGSYSARNEVRAGAASCSRSSPRAPSVQAGGWADISLTRSAPVSKRRLRLINSRRRHPRPPERPGSLAGGTPRGMRPASATTKQARQQRFERAFRLLLRADRDQKQQPAHDCPNGDKPELPAVRPSLRCD
jgi:hypothetical protein